MLERFPPRCRDDLRKNPGKSWMDRGGIKMLWARATRALLAVCGMSLAVQSALAAEAGGATAPIGDGGFSIIDWAIVVVMIGAALFAVCRTSRRN